ncbi:DUF4363 family protein [Paenibacillus sp. YYML68]|uniref:DUF4363 family protein n=1 Tax=Paenibacillus sp. YYML68 TaxID=2909250 RepID=UPI002490967A|nr:DUF4363 family protein [Paenibacillus sp. YYML68]
MRNSFITGMLVGIVLLFFIGYFTAVNIAMKSGKGTEQQLHHIMQAAREERWQEAQVYVKQALGNWNGLQYLLMLNFSSEDYDEFEEKLHALEQAVELQDKRETLMTGGAALYHWNKMVRIIPGP